MKKSTKSLLKLFAGSLLFPMSQFGTGILITAPAQTKSQYRKLSYWETLFVLNYYEQEKLKKPTDKIDKYNIIRRDINNELERLYALVNDSEFFKIDTQNNPFLDRDIENILKALESSGDEERINRILNNKEGLKSRLSIFYARGLKNEYRKIVKNIQAFDAEPAFKVLMLRETLMYVYKTETIDGCEQIIKKKREKHKTISSHMIMNDTILDYLYKNMKEYNKFSSAYADSVKFKQQKVIQEKGEFTNPKVNNYKMGKWIRFEKSSLYSNENFYNANLLTALVFSTQWCTKHQASTQINGGDFYVFVDNDGKPHIAIRMEDGGIAEIRGIKSGRKQEIEEEYIKVAESLKEYLEQKESDDNSLLLLAID